MLTTRTHAVIDFSVSAVLAASVLRPALSGRVRAVLGAAGLYHASYSALTDYEGGAVPLISMRTHLLLDTVGAAALCGASLLTPSRRERNGLLAVGLAELAVVALSRRQPSHGPRDMTYQPLDTPKPVAPGVWVVDSAIGPHMPVRMTVVRLRNGDLLLHSPTRHTPALHRALDAIGRVRHLVAPNIAHWTFIKSWQDAVPDALVWAAPCLAERGQVQRSGLRIDRTLGGHPPEEWGGEFDLATVPGAAGFHEVAILHRPSRTLLLTDLIVNLEREKTPWLLRPFAFLTGMLGPVGRAPAYLRAIVLAHGGQAKAAAQKIVDWRPERVIMAHGRPLDREAATQLRQSLGWLLR